MGVVAGIFSVVGTYEIAFKVKNTGLATGGAFIDANKILAHLLPPFFCFFTCTRAPFFWKLSLKIPANGTRRRCFSETEKSFKIYRSISVDQPLYAGTRPIERI